MGVDVPVDPDADTARDWAAQELAKDEYRPAEPGWFDALLQRINEFFSQAFSFRIGGDGGVSVLAVVLVVAAVAAVVYLIVGPVGRARRARRTRTAVFDDDTRPASEIRTAAQAAAAAGDWATAIVETYRATIRSLEEREILASRPGMTAQEAAHDTSERFPDVLHAIAAVADDFDAIRYGHHAGTQKGYERAVTVDRSLAGRSLLTAAAP